ncbi:MAG: hypothetical protein WC980_10760, partial [Candidatus Brocadiia bacterium]
MGTARATRLWPWTIEAPGQDGPAHVVPEGPGGTVAAVYGDNQQESAANARLIAAAPELLAALNKADGLL